MPLNDLTVQCHRSMHGVMGIANAQRTISYLRILIQFVSQEQYRDVVQM
jgi:hypothetical protein